MEDTAPNPFQRTEEWFSDRLGCLTGSAVADILPSPKTHKYLKTRADLMDKIIAERITGIPRAAYRSPEMEWGVEHEADARAEYEARTCGFVDLCGFIPHQTLEWFGASPDGLVGTDGLIEIKCPASVTHLRYRREGVVPEEYRPQMIAQLLCTGRQWVDFVSYDPRMRGKYEPLSFFCVRFNPSPEERQAMFAECEKFLADVDAEMNKLLEGAQ